MMSVEIKYYFIYTSMPTIFFISFENQIIAFLELNWTKSRGKECLYMLSLIFYLR